MLRRASPLRLGRPNLVLPGFATIGRRRVSIKAKPSVTESSENAVAARVEPQRQLCRNFIHDSLYHPQHGYFSKRAVIFSNPEPVPFPQLQDTNAFTERIKALYDEYDAYANEEEEALQVWHTPTELFKPWYGQALARYILDRHQQDARCGEPLTIYEMGAGNGTLMGNILDYVEQSAPHVYATLRYRVIEISQQLTERQRWNQTKNTAAAHSGFTGKHQSRIQVIHKSIFDWDQLEPDPCFFIAMEVIDNFAHDAIRWDWTPDARLSPTGSPLQTFITVDPVSKAIEEEFTPVEDPLILEYLRVREQTSYRSPYSESRKRLWPRLRAHLPLAANLSPPEFLPTMQFRFLQSLCNFFPKHRLVLSDFDRLPTPLEGVDAPVVQTRQRGMMIPSSTYLVARGWFDIFFPTNFELMQEVYGLLRDKSVRKTQVCTHRELLERYADLKQTTTRSGENPMLEHYGNVKFFLT